MKKLLALIMILTVVLCSVVFTGCGDETETLVVYNWAEYIDTDVCDDFEEYYFETYGKEIEVIYSTFDTNETAVSKLLNGDANVDMLCPSEYSIEQLLKADMIQPFYPDRSISNYGNVDGNILDRIRGTFGEVTKKDGTTVNMIDYFVPYMWGTLAILYNEAYVTEEELDEYGWGVMWNDENNPDLNGKILMKDSIRDAYAAAVGYLQQTGRLPEAYQNADNETILNECGPEMRAAVEQVLIEERGVLQGYEVDFGKEDMIKERALVCLAWSGDALWAMEDCPDDVSLNYYIPSNFANVWFDGWVIPKAAKNPEAAKIFIDYLCRPDIAMRNAMEIGYTCSLSAEALKESEGTEYDAIAILEENEYDVDEYFDDERRYPDTTEDRFAMMRDYGENNNAVVSSWEKVKVSDFSTELLIILGVILGMCALVVLGFTVVTNIQSKRKLRE